MTVHHQDPWLTVHVGDCRAVLATMEPESVHTVVTSPPYWGLRDYGHGDQLGLEPTPDEYVANMVAVFREVRRVLRDDGTLWLNLGDSYHSTTSGNGGYSDKSTLSGFTSPDTKGRRANESGARHRIDSGLKPKDLVGIPWRTAFALQRPWLRCRGCNAEHHADAWGRFPNGRLICPACDHSKGNDVSEPGWYLRSDIIWAKPNPMPESVTDRPTKSHEYLFLLAKSERYFFDADAVRETLEHPNRTGTNPRLAVDNTGLGAHGSAKTGGIESNPAGRNIRSVWTIATQPYPGAHFATFPPKLVEPCILAGTSERGVCPECGAPWRRVVERERAREGATPTSRDTKAAGNSAMVSLPAHARTDASKSGMGTPAVTTTGWRPTCTHDATPVPATVLDCFGGSGTTAMVAQHLSRRAVLIDLNPDYIDQQLKRNQAMPLGLEAA